MEKAKLDGDKVVKRMIVGIKRDHPTFQRDVDNTRIYAGDQAKWAVSMLRVINASVSYGFKRGMDKSIEEES